MRKRIAVTLPETIRQLLRLLDQAADRRLRLNMASTAALVIAGGALAALSPLALKNLVDAAADRASAGAITLNALLAPAAAYVAVLCAARAVGDVRPLFANEIEQRLMASLRRHFFGHVLRLPLSVLLRRRSGELLHSLELGRAGTQLMLTHLINSFAPAAVELVVMALILAQLRQPALILVFSVTAALYTMVFAVGSIRVAAHARAVTDTSLDVHGRLTEGLVNVEMLRCFGAEAEVERALDASSSTLIGHWRAYYLTSTASTLAATVLFGVALTACLFVAAESMASGSMSVGGLVLSSVYLLQMMRPLEILGSAARDVSRAVGFVQPLLEVLREAQETPNASRIGLERGSTQHPPSIKFEGLTFGYDPDCPVINGLDLEIAAGSTTAVVGPSGSGKSSLVRLLLRLYAPQSGRILLDGCPLDTLPLADLRAQMALVPQDASLLHASIATNISLGMPVVSPTDLIRASAAAQLHHLVESLPDRYETQVGERGLRLSGGERQRLAIARALLRRSPVVLLDEPTSMLDSKTESEVLSAIREAAARSTTLIVAHRLSTVMDADEIVVMDQGRIRERGKHRDLLARKGLYSQLWRRQVEGSDGNADV